MLNIYKTNKIELISEVLAKELLINPPFITDNLKISIQNYFLSKWMKDQITLKNDINALCEFQTLAEYTCLLYTSPSPRDSDTSRMPSSA